MNQEKEKSLESLLGKDWIRICNDSNCKECKRIVKDFEEEGFVVKTKKYDGVLPIDRASYLLEIYRKNMDFKREGIKKLEKMRNKYVKELEKFLDKEGKIDDKDEKIERLLPYCMDIFDLSGEVKEKREKRYKEIDFQPIEVLLENADIFIRDWDKS